MKEYGLFGIAAAIIVILFVAISGTFQVAQTEQALVLRFGEPVGGRGLVTDPGLHFKIPLVENVITRSNQILNLESPNQEVLASDNTRIQVDAFLRYRIVDLLKFYQSVQTVDRANSQLGYVLNSAIRRVLGDADLSQIVRTDRQNLMNRIRGEVNTETERLGIDAIDVRIPARRSARTDFGAGLPAHEFRAQSRGGLLPRAGPAGGGDDPRTG